MTKLEIADAAVGCLQEIADIAEMAVVPVTESSCDETLMDVQSAADDIAVHLGELRALLEEAT